MIMAEVKFLIEVVKGEMLIVSHITSQFLIGMVGRDVRR